MEYPYTNTHELNLDWIISIVKDFKEKYQNFDQTVADALQSILDAKEGSLTEIETALESATATIQSEAATAINDMQAEKASILEVMGQTLQTAIRTIEARESSSIAAINLAYNQGVARLETLIQSFPLDDAQIVGQLQIINSILNGTDALSMEWRQGVYNGESPFAWVNSPNAVSSLRQAGCSGRVLHVQANTPGHVIAYIYYWTGNLESIVSVPVNAAEATYTFPNNATYFSVILGNSPNLSTPINLSDVTASAEWLVAGFIQRSEFENAMLSKVDRAGENQVTPQNIEGMRFTRTETEVEGGNIFDPDTMIYAAGVYVFGDGGRINQIEEPYFNAYVIPIEKNSKYVFPQARFAVVAKGNVRYSEVVGTTLNYAAQVDNTGEGAYLFLTYPAAKPATSITVKKVTEVISYSDFILPDWMRARKPPTDGTGGSLASDGTMSILGRSAVKDGQMIAFKGKFTSFNGFTLNFVGPDVTNFIAVTGSSIAIKSGNTAPAPVNHGVTIQNDVTLTVEFIEGTAKITLYSMGGVYSQTVSWDQTGGTVTQPQIKSDGTAFSKANLVTSYDCAIRDIWYFGDSYIGSASPARWCYYLKASGYMANLLINGSAGADSSDTMISFNALMKYGTPRIAVFATGMNDGSDSDTAPQAYTERRTEFLTLCESNGIEPVFCTIPSVPSVNNEQKNAWVRLSGYRYIDFAAAVGADGSGMWYPGMLSSDGVHPTEAGAKALYTQVLIDLPEVTIS